MLIINTNNEQPTIVRDMVATRGKYTVASDNTYFMTTMRFIFKNNTLLYRVQQSGVPQYNSHCWYSTIDIPHTTYYTQLNGKIYRL